jgi:hypothetical protein
MVWEIIAGVVALGLLAISGAVANYLSNLAEKNGYEVREAKIRHTIQDIVMSLHQTTVQGLKEPDMKNDSPSVRKKLSKKQAREILADACNRAAHSLRAQGIELSNKEIEDKIERQVLDLKAFLSKSLLGFGK